MAKTTGIPDYTEELTSWSTAAIYVVRQKK